MRDVRKILNILSGRYADLSHMNWYWGLGFLKINRIGASFLRLARECGAELPKQVEKILKEETENQKQRNDAVRPWIEDINTVLKESEAEFAFLKGSVLAYCTMGGKKIYPSGERVFNDVDILTTSNHLDKIDSALRSLGFIQGEWVDGEIKPFSRREILFRRMSRGETAPYLVKTQAKVAPYIEVDVNFSLDCVPQKDGELVEEMLKNTALYQFSSRKRLCSLTPEKFFLFLILHQYKEATLYWMTKRNKDHLLYKYYDIYLLIKSGLVDVEKFRKEVSFFGAEKESYAVLFWCNKLFGGIEDFVLVKPMQCNDDVLFLVEDKEQKENYRWKCGILERVERYDRKKLIEKV